MHNIIYKFNKIKTTYNLKRKELSSDQVEREPKSQFAAWDT
jgi:hypothetical protein